MRILIEFGAVAPGKMFMKYLLPNHSKPLMRVLYAKEQDSLFPICRKLREGDVLKFVREITHRREN